MNIKQRTIGIVSMQKYKGNKKRETTRESEAENMIEQVKSED